MKKVISDLCCSAHMAHQVLACLHRANAKLACHKHKYAKNTVRNLYRTARACHALSNTPKRQEPSTSAFHCTLPATTWSLCCSAACRNGMDALVAVEKASTATLWCGTRARNLSMVSGSTAGAGGSSSSRSATNCCSKSALSGPECLQQTTGSERQKSKTRKYYTFWRQFDEKPSIIPGCPGS